jgi:hypothetical protein
VHCERGPGCSCRRDALGSSGSRLMRELRLQGCAAGPAKAYPELRKRICESCASTR